MEINEKLNILIKLFPVLEDYIQKRKNPCSFSEEELKEILSLSKSNNILIVSYLALKNDGVVFPDQVEKNLNLFYTQNIHKTALFEEERKALYKYMNERQISFLPLKGILINTLYPDYGTREFADNDILFDQKHKKEIKEFFVGRGYEVESYGKYVHDTYLKKPVYNFEMHRILFQDTSRNKTMKVFENYYKDFLEHALVKDGYERKVSDEDFFLYFLCHFYKHYSNGGAGIRTLLDIRIYLIKHPDMDRNYLNQEYKKMNIQSFVDSILSLIDHLFLGKELSKEEKDILVSMVDSGTYGNIETNVKNNMKKKTKTQYILSRIFPPLSFYKSTYPIAYYSIIGIPFVFLYRLVRGVTVSRSHTKKELETLNDKESKSK